MRVKKATPQSSCAFVEENNYLVGLIYPENIISWLAQKLPLESVSVSQVMTKKFVSRRSNELEDIDDLITLFSQEKIKILPIVDDNGKGIGIITPNSLLESIDTRKTRSFNPPLVASDEQDLIIDVTKNSNIQAQSNRLAYFLESSLNEVIVFFCRYLTHFICQSKSYR